MAHRVFRGRAEPLGAPSTHLEGKGFCPAEKMAEHNGHILEEYLLPFRNVRPFRTIINRPLLSIPRWPLIVVDGEMDLMILRLWEGRKRIGSIRREKRWGTFFFFLEIDFSQ